MGKIFRLINGETKKIFSSITMFVMASIFIISLAFLPHFFTPQDKQTTLNSYTISDSSVVAASKSFFSYKNESDNYLISLTSKINKLASTEENFKNVLIDKKNKLVDLRKKLDTAISQNDVIKCTSIQLDMVKQIDKILEYYSSCFNNYSIPVILVTQQFDDDFRNELGRFRSILTNQTGSKDDIIYFVKLNDTIEKNAFIKNLTPYFKEIQNININKQNVQNLINDYSTYKEEYKETLSNEINSLYSLAQSNPEINNSKEKIAETQDKSLRYLSTNNYMSSLLSSSIKIEVSNTMSDEKLNNFKGFSELNSYEQKENKSKALYMLYNNKLDNEITSMFSFNANSGNKTNAFDYMYFAMEIMSIFIIAFTVIIGAGMISKEQNEGTMKLLAIRPFSRNKIMFSKITATMLYSLLFVLVGIVMSLITGIIIYGISFPSMLVILNATTAFTLPIWVVFLIYIASLMFKIYFYALLAIAISTIFRSYIASVCLSSGIYLLNLVLTFVLNGSKVLKYNLFSHLDLFKYFGGAFLTNATTKSGITGLFAMGTFADMSIFIPISVIAISIILLNFIIFYTFKKRDI